MIPDLTPFKGRIVRDQWCTVGIPEALHSSGKVCYEVTLRPRPPHSAFQYDACIGWASPELSHRICPATEDYRIGSCNASWGIICDDAVDDTTWDLVIGAAVDMQTGAMMFARNGDWQPFVAEDLRDHAKLACRGVYPAMSMRNAIFDMNLGALPFRFPPPGGFQPIDPTMNNASVSLLRGPRDGFQALKHLEQRTAATKWDQPIPRDMLQDYLRCTLQLIGAEPRVPELISALEQSALSIPGKVLTRMARVTNATAGVHNLDAVVCALCALHAELEGDTHADANGQSHAEPCELKRNIRTKPPSRYWSRVTSEMKARPQTQMKSRQEMKSRGARSKFCESNDQTRAVIKQTDDAQQLCADETRRVPVQVVKANEKRRTAEQELASDRNTTAVLEKKLAGVKDGAKVAEVRLPPMEAAMAMLPEEAPVSTKQAVDLAKRAADPLAEEKQRLRLVEQEVVAAGEWKAALETKITSMEAAMTVSARTAEEEEDLAVAEASSVASEASNAAERLKFLKQELVAAGKTKATLEKKLADAEASAAVGKQLDGDGQMSSTEALDAEKQGAETASLLAEQSKKAEERLREVEDGYETQFRLLEEELQLFRLEAALTWKLAQVELTTKVTERAISTGMMPSAVSNGSTTKTVRPQNASNVVQRGDAHARMVQAEAGLKAAEEAEETVATKSASVASRSAGGREAARTQEQLVMEDAKFSVRRAKSGRKKVETARMDEAKGAGDDEGAHPGWVEATRPAYSLRQTGRYWGEQKQRG